MRNDRPCSCSCLSLVFVALHAGAQTADESLQRVIADYERFQRQYDPLSAGQEGDREALRRLPDATPEAEQAQRKELVAFGERLAGIDARQLSAESALNHTLLTRIVKESIEEAGFDFGRIAFQNDSGFHTLADYLGAHDDHRVARGCRCVARATGSAADVTTSRTSRT